jgi:NAD(P)H-flavin reductase
MAPTLEQPAVMHPLAPELFRIQRVREESHDTFSFEIAPASGPRKLSFRAGQFVMLYVYGAGEVPVTLSGDPANHRYYRITARAVGNVTRALRQLKRGDLLGVRGPFGTCWPVEQAEGNDVLLVAGGIGIVALRAALYRLFADRSRYGKIVLLYGARKPEDLLHYPDLRQWKEEQDLELYCSVDRATAAWQGHVGVMTTLLPRAPVNPANAIAFICGPEVVTRFALRELLYRGLAGDRLYVYFQRNMQCGHGLCGHCQFGPFFICRDGPVLRYDHIQNFLGKAEV